MRKTTIRYTFTHTLTFTCKSTLEGSSNAFFCNFCNVNVAEFFATVPMAFIVVMCMTYILGLWEQWTWYQLHQEAGCFTAMFSITCMVEWKLLTQFLIMVS